MNKINRVKRSGADRQQLKDLMVPAANLEGYFIHTDFSAKIIVLKNSRMADNLKSMARTTAEREAKLKKWNAFRRISIFLVLETTVTQHIQTFLGGWEGLEKGERKGKGMGNESNEVSRDKRLKLTSCDVLLNYPQEPETPETVKATVGWWEFSFPKLVFCSSENRLSALKAIYLLFLS